MAVVTIRKSFLYFNLVFIALNFDDAFTFFWLCVIFLAKFLANSTLAFQVESIPPLAMGPRGKSGSASCCCFSWSGKEVKATTAADKVMEEEEEDNDSRSPTNYDIRYLTQCNAAAKGRD